MFSTISSTTLTTNGHFHDISPMIMITCMVPARLLQPHASSMAALTLRCYCYSSSVTIVPRRKTSRTTMIRASISMDDCSSSESKKKSNSVRFTGKVNKVYTYFSLHDVTSIWNISLLFWSGTYLSGLWGQEHGNPLLHRWERWIGVWRPRRRPEADPPGHGEVSHVQDLICLASCERTVEDAITDRIMLLLWCD